MIGRRGMVGEGLQWVIRLTAATILLLLLLIQIWMITEQRAKPYGAELALYEYRLVQGPNGLFYEEDGIVEPGVVDAAKVSDLGLYNAYSASKDLAFGARIRLYNDSTLIGSDRYLRTAVHNPAVADVYLELGSAGLHGDGGAVYERHVYPVMIRLGEGAERTPGWLDVEVVKRT